MGCVYLARNRINNKRYVGKTVRSLNKRISAHVKGTYPTPFTCAIAKYGPENFEWSVLFESSNNKELLRVETSMIAMLQTKAPKGYNLTNGGEGTIGYTKSPETRAKLSAAIKGTIRSSETRAKIAAANRKRRTSVKTREKQRIAHTGRRHTPETIAKMRGRIMPARSPETLAKMSAAAKNRTYSAELRAKMSAAQKARQAKLRESQK